MRRLVLVCLIAGTARANEPPPIPVDDVWVRALNAAHSALETCTQLGVTNKVYGDVTVSYDRKRKTWKRSASKSLGWIGDKAAACVQDAVARQFKDSPEYETRFDDTLEHVQTIGTAVVVLPPPATLLPVWRRARTDAKARKDLAKLLPPDYQLTADACLKTTRRAIEDVEYLWLPQTGAWVPRLWDKQVAAAVGDRISVAMWHAGELVTKSPRGLCLVTLDAAKQTALRVEMDKTATCLAGNFEDVLLHPRAVLPAGSYAQVSTQNGRVCALSTAGEITCCGPTDAALPPPPKGPFTQVAAGGKFGCALDTKGNATCWGAIGAAPSGPFTKISAEYSHACGVRPGGELACWGAGNYGVAQPPAGAFRDVAAAQFSTCGVHRDGSIACWGEPSRGTHPAGAFARIAADWTHACGIRTDGSLGCWRDEQVDTPLAGSFTDVAVGDLYSACALAKDGSIACVPPAGKPDAIVTPPPTGTFTQLAGDHSTYCAVATDHHVSCWGEPWPGSWSGDNTWPYAKVLGLTTPPPPAKPGMIAMGGRIVDERGQPIANAEVMACGAASACTLVERSARWKPGSFAQLSAGFKVEPDELAFTKTGADGRWSAQVKRPSKAGWGDRLAYVVTAPGREAQVREATSERDLPDEITLRPASSVDVDARCGAAACPEPLRIALTPYNWQPGTHVERLPPGSHQLEVISGFGQPGERRAVVTVNVGFAGGAQRARATLTSVGTGATVTGIADLDGRTPAGIHVSIRCDRPASMPIYREAVTANGGAFELHDVGAAPCDIDASGPNAIGSTEIDKVPADGVHVHAISQPLPRD